MPIPFVPRNVGASLADARGKSLWPECCAGAGKRRPYVSLDEVNWAALDGTYNNDRPGHAKLRFGTAAATSVVRGRPGNPAGGKWLAGISA